MIGAINSPFAGIAQSVNRAAGHANAQGGTQAPRAGRFDAVSLSPGAKKPSPMQKMMNQLKEQMQAVKDSDMSGEEKESALEALEEQIKILQEQMLQENLKKEDEAKPEEEDEATKALREKGVQVIGKGLMLGVAAASSELKTAAVPMRAYRIARMSNKGRGDPVAMGRAMAYVSPGMRALNADAQRLGRTDSGVKPDEAAANRPEDEREQESEL